MSTKLDEVLADLATESDLLDDTVAGLDEGGWRTPTPAEGWDVAHQIAHLAWTDEVAVTAATDPDGWAAIRNAAAQDVTGYNDRCADEGAAEPGTQILHRWRTARSRLADVLRGLPPGERIAWFGPPMSATSMATARFMETWAHGLDVAEALRVDRPVTDRIRHVVHLGVRTRDFAFLTHGLDAPDEPFRVELTSPGGEQWCYGPEEAEQRIRGSAEDFCLLVTQRRHHADLALVAEGEDGRRWLEIAQVFAGPSGAGRGSGRADGGAR